MKTKSTKSFDGRHAFTLIELIVVLTILVGLAGVLIPTLTNMVGRTNRSTTAVNISEISGAIQRFESIYISYPDNFDSLMSDATGTDLTTLSSALTTVTEDVALTTNTLAALTNVGISNVGRHAATDSTFDLPTVVALTDTTVLKGLTAAQQVALGLETTGAVGKYIVLGIGSRSELTGTIMLDAPVHFPRDAASNPTDVYSRFLAVFQITDGSAALQRAKFVGVLSPEGEGIGSQLGNYFDITAND